MICIYRQCNFYREIIAVKYKKLRE
ncbi:unnamed protein product [Nezara viridula]|uniref:Uncharacterized protein n=1 Tax=Nezara viridula TaxID=85310 RepID=A0A9P0HF11_NEZVI|nr:unnamed protein product [Nezara viridula]